MVKKYSWFDKLKFNSFNYITFKIILNIIFVSVSCFMAAHLFTSSRHEWYFKLMLFVFAIALDLFANYMVSKGKFIANKENVLKSLPYYIPYFIYSLVIIYSAIDFSTVEQNEINKSNNITSYQIQLVKDDIATLKDNIKNAKSFRKSLTNYGQEYKQYSVIIESNQNALYRASEKLKDYNLSSTNSYRGVQDRILTVFGLFEISINQIIWFIISGFLIVGLLETSWDIDFNVKGVKRGRKKSNKKRL